MSGLGRNVLDFDHNPPLTTFGEGHFPFFFQNLVKILIYCFIGFKSTLINMLFPHRLFWFSPLPASLHADPFLRKVMSKKNCIEAHHPQFHYHSQFLQAYKGDLNIGIEVNS